MIVRLQKYLADSGVASRRKSEELILKGLVTVNDKLVKELGTKIDDEKDIVKYKGNRVLQNRKYVYIMLNKPEGVITTVKDQFNRFSVTDILKNVRERVFPVGRLDYDTSGLLLLTNDGDLTYKLTHPKHEIEKTYIAKLFGTPNINEINKFKSGIYINGVKSLPAKIEIIEEQQKYCYTKIVIKEGKNRQVRKMCKAINHPVATLQRIAIGNLQIGDLKKGKYRYLTEKEIKYLKSL